jgi:NAD(P)-dependent dehydrogenase (short-subunit alcohol dehydrogenase family)
MARTTADIPDLSGRVAVVTSANGGLGLEVSQEPARRGAFVVMASHDQGKAEEARGSILSEIPGAFLELHRSASRRSHRCTRQPSGSCAPIPTSTCSSTTRV